MLLTYLHIRQTRYTAYGELLFRVIFTSEPCGEAAHEDDSESGSPFLYVYVNQSFTTSESAKGCINTYVYG